MGEGRFEGGGGDCASVREELGVRGDGGGRKGKASAAKHEISLVGGEGVRAQTPRIQRREGRGGEEEEERGGMEWRWRW